MAIRHVRLMFVAVVAVVMLTGFAPVASAQTAPQQQQGGFLESLTQLNLGNALASLGLGG